MNPGNIHSINQANNNIPQFNCGEYIKDFWKSIPLFVKTVIILTLVIYIFNLFFPIIAACLVNVPYYTVFRINLWRLFTTVFVTTSLLNILFAFLFWIKEAMSLESSSGTLRYMFIFLINSVMIQLIYTLIMLIAYLFIGNDSVLLMNVQGGRVENNGLWPIIMSELTILCMANPESTMRLFLFPCDIKAKYYPFCLLIFFTVMGGGIQFDVFSGVINGVLYHFVIKNRLSLSDTFILKCEECIVFKWLKKVPGFISLTKASSILPISIPQTSSPNTSNNESNANAPSSFTNVSPPTGKGYSSFSGKGTTLGGSYGTGKGEYQGVSQNPK